MKILASLVEYLKYHTPTSLKEALNISATNDVQFIAGGTDFYPSKPPGPLTCDLIDLSRISDLSGIEQTADAWRIGATTTWTEIVHSDLPPYFKGLQDAAREIGSVQIQNAGTIGGNLCNASPAADGVPPLLTLGAQIELQSHHGTRLLPLENFTKGVRKTALEDGEALTAIVIPVLPGNIQSSFEKLGSRRYMVISISIVAVAIGLDRTGRIDFARVAVGACSPVAQRLPDLEASLTGQKPENARIDPVNLLCLSPIDDVRGSRAYRLEAVAEQCRRSLQRTGATHG